LKGKKYFIAIIYNLVSLKISQNSAEMEQQRFFSPNFLLM
jgi:hypothetical protein